MRRFAAYTLVSLAVLLWADPAPADLPLSVSYQGQLLDAAGAPRNGNVTVIVRILDDPNAGTLIYEEIHTQAPVIDGIFDLEIGAGIATVGGTQTVFGVAVFAGSVRFLELEVDSEVLRPRQAILAVPYALRSQQAVNADTVDGLHASDLDQSAHTTSSANPHAVSSGQIGAAALGHGHSGADLTANSITAREIAAGAVGASEILNGAVGSAQVALNSLTALDLASGSVGASEIADNAVGSDEVINNSLTAADLAPNSVGSSEIAAGAVGSAEIASFAVVAGKIGSGAVGATEIANAAVRRSEISGTEVGFYTIPFFAATQEPSP